MVIKPDRSFIDYKTSESQKFPVMLFFLSDIPLLLILSQKESVSVTVY